MLYSILNLYFFVNTILLTGLNTNDIFDSISFTNDSYTGYISENMGFNQPQINNEQSKRHNSKHEPNHKSTYIRFIDDLKPSINFRLKNLDDCVSFDFKSLNLTLKTNDYDQETTSLFEIDHDNFLCTKQKSNCICYFQIRLSDDPIIRDRINREAKESYHFQLNLDNTQTNINVNMLDDNDLEPMFDPSEYVFELNQYDKIAELINLPEFTVIGKVSAMDPDLTENAMIKYHSKYDPYFAVNSITGEIYIKKNSQFLFNLNESEFNFEIKAIDSGLKLNLVNNLIKLNQSIFDSVGEGEEFMTNIKELI